MMSPSVAPMIGAEHSDERAFDEVRADFPILDQQVHGRRLVYLDSAASSQMPRAVIETLVDYQARLHANVHRGVHTLSQRATDAYEQARVLIAHFIHAPTPNECVFVRGATEGINLVANSWGITQLGPGDTILISATEHHANIVPWQMVSQRTGCTIDVIPVDDRGVLDQGAYRDRLEQGDVRLVAVSHVSNALGTIHPVTAMCDLAHAHDALVMVDGCQAAPHMVVDVQAIGADFYVFSGHKMYGPTGIGVLYARAELLDAMPPWMGGGDMIETVTWEATTYAEPPARFEAGTPAIAQAVALGAAVRYILSIGRERIAAHEHALLEAATERMRALPKMRIFGTAPEKAAVISFDFEDIHPNDIGTILDGCGVAVRTGQHCAEPLMTRLGVHATARASFGIYNGMDDVDALIEALQTVRDLFA